MGKMQATYDGVDLDRSEHATSSERWRRIIGTFGDDTGLDGKRVLAVDFYIYANDAATLEARKAATIADFDKVNGRFTLTLDDTGGGLFADVAPNDGIHSDTACVIVQQANKAQTGHRLNMRLLCVAGVSLPSAGGVPGASVPTWEGLVGNIAYGKDFNSARIEAYRFLATFTTTFDDDQYGPFTVNSVETAGGKARFVVATAPPTFKAGMRLKITAGTAYLGIHLITAIDVATKKITTDTAYTATATGTAYVGNVKTGEENYLAVRSTILTDYMKVETSGARDEPGVDPVTDPSSKMVLKSEVRDGKDKDQNQFQVFLQSGYMKRKLENTASARGLSMQLARSEPERWPKDGGPKPLYLGVKASVPCDVTVLGDGKLYAVWEASLKADVEAAVMDETGETALKPLSISVGFDDESGRIECQCTYQARNSVNVAYSVETTIKIDDNRIRAQESGSEGFHVDQRPPGPPPGTATVTATRVGAGNALPTVNPPPCDFAGCFWDLSTTVTSGADNPLDGQFDANLYAVSKTNVYILTKYRDGEGGGGLGFGGDIGEIFEQDLADAQSGAGFTQEQTSTSGI